MKNPLISIVTVCFNGEKTIKRTIESVLNQTYANIEYILIDGNSSDNTVEIITSYSLKFSEKGIKYKWISEPDKGIYDAMNKGTSLATGEFVSVIGSDDWYELEGIETIVRRYKETLADYIHGNIKVYSSKNKFLKIRKAGSRKDMIKEMTFFHPASFIKKEIIDDLKGYSLEYKICSDYDLILRVISGGYLIEYIDKIITNVSYGGISTSQVINALSESHTIRVKNGYNPILSKLFYIKSFFIHKLKKFLVIN